MKITEAAIREMVAKSLAQRVDPAVAKGVEPAVAVAVAKISGAATPSRQAPTAQKSDTGVPLDKLNSAQAAIISAARSITPAPSHIPDESEIRAAHGSAGPMSELDRVKAVMIASRGKAKR